MFDDFKELLSIFHAHGVKYLIVGGYAALAKSGAPLEGLTAADFADRSKFFRIGREPKRSSSHMKPKSSV